jgi:hypothetical protein
MRWSFGVAAAVVAAVLTVVVPVRAQEQPGDIRVDETAKPHAATFPSLARFSAYGFSSGICRVFGGDLGKHAQVKPVLQTDFRYRFSDVWIGTGEFAFAWNDFKDRGDTVLTFTVGTLGVARTIGHVLGTDLRAAGGLGVYRWNYKFNGESLRDRDRRLPNGTIVPGTERFYRGISPGGYLGLEDEYRLTRHITLLGLVQQHYVLTANKSKFNSIFNENHALLTLRLGITYHFSPDEGILWEGKKVKKIRLQSGKEGL